MLDTGARGSTTTFVERGIGDVLIAWENEALLAVEELGKGEFEIVVPSLSILAEPPVAVVDAVARRKGTGERRRGLPRVPLLARGAGADRASTTTGRASRRWLEKYAAQVPEDASWSKIDEFGGWKAAQAKFFADGGVFDQIYQPGR